MKIPNIKEYETSLLETLEEYRAFIEMCDQALDYDEEEYLEKKRFVDLWDAAYKVLADWEINLLIYDTYCGMSVSQRREALTLKKSSYNKYLNNLRRKIRNELGVKPPMKCKTSIENLDKGYRKKDA